MIRLTGSTSFGVTEGDHAAHRPPDGVPAPHPSTPAPTGISLGRMESRFIFIFLVLSILLSSCAPGGQQQTQPDPRLKSFHIVSAHIILLDNQAEVDGMVQNAGHDRYPFDVTIMATFYDGSGHVIGHAQGVAEDIFPGMIRPFILLGQVDSLHYSRMQLVPVSLRERRYEKGLPSPPPVVP